eukprot:1154317-Pelagomonas_calceolata.AAC.5
MCVQIGKRPEKPSHQRSLTPGFTPGNMGKRGLVTDQDGTHAWCAHRKEEVDGQLDAQLDQVRHDVVALVLGCNPGWRVRCDGMT